MNLINDTFLTKIARRFSLIVRLKRYLLAFLDSVTTTKKTYSQYGEDLLVMELLPGLTPSYGIYIEVGANQPTRISNTYLFYRLGYKGVVVEPNRELTGLFKRFRQKDIHLEIGCSDNSGVGNFKKTYASVGSGFADNIKPLNDVVNFVPLLTVDEIWRDTGLKNVFLLSIDTEGFDLNVLKGANETLKNTACLIIETRHNDVNEINAILQNAGFRLIKTTDCNYIWINDEIVKTMSMP